MRIGIYQSYWGDVGGGQRYLAAVAAALSQTHDVELVHHRQDFEAECVGAAIEVNLRNIRFRYTPPLQRVQAGGLNPWRRLRDEVEWGAEISEPYELFINCGNGVPFFCHAQRGVLITFFPETSQDQYHGRTTEAWQNRPSTLKLAARAFHHIEWRRRFHTYQHCVTCSHYSEHWLKRLWGVDADVLYPPVRQAAVPGSKENVIISVGRIDGSRHKRQDVLITAFKSLCDAGMNGWRLSIVGSLAKTAAAAKYLDGLRTAASGYPIQIETDVTSQFLNRSLAEAKIFWHSMGFGVDADANPGRLEHFGMVATEAMSAGCVALLFNGGGLPESVKHGENGFLWRTLDDLTELTRRVAGDAALQSRLSAAARRRASEFSQAVFESNVERIFSPVLVSNDTLRQAALASSAALARASAND